MATPLDEPGRRGLGRLAPASPAALLQPTCPSELLLPGALQHHGSRPLGRFVEPICQDVEIGSVKCFEVQGFELFEDFHFSVSVVSLGPVCRPAWIPAIGNLPG